MEDQDRIKVGPHGYGHPVVVAAAQHECDLHAAAQMAHLEGHRVSSHSLHGLGSFDKAQRGSFYFSKSMAAKAEG